MIVVLMGVSGVGKTTIGKRVASQLGYRFIDADDHHPPENVAKMAAGVPLEDADRWPWLDTLNQLLRKAHDIVVGCSALKESYRQRLLAGLRNVRLVHLHGSRELIAARIAQRKHRYMPASLLDSQFAALEPPVRALKIDVAADLADSVRAIVNAVREA